MGYVKKIFTHQSNNLSSRLVAFLAAAIITAVSTLGIYLYQNSFSYEVYLNGSIVGTVKDQKIIEDVYIDVEENLTERYGEDFTYQGNIVIEKVKNKTQDYLTAAETAKLITDKIVVYKTAAVILVDEKEMLVVETEQAAKNILESIKQPYEEKFVTDNENIKLLDIDFKQNVKIEEQEVLADNILSFDEAQKIVNGEEETTQTYLVASGDSAWTISRSFEVGMRSLEEANPKKNLEELKPGDVINLTVIKPYLDVEYTVEETATEKINFNTEKIKDSSIYVGSTKVKQEGKYGEKEIVREIVYLNGSVSTSKVLNEKTLIEPTNKIILVGTKSRPVSAVSSSKSASAYNSSLGNAIVSEAKKYIGTPYRYGGSTPAGFDCSGFTSYVYRQVGISIPRTSYSQRYVGGYVAKNNLKPGDLVAFSGHVGIYVGGGNFIHSPSPGKRVEITSLNSAYWRSKYISGRRLY
ncbi:C40 family peptidase [Alkalibacter mobilis]|uniref:C40 family peptidase n=1 Tax=Alkalibacter mobilis TaxID=2787712 RepID=UPI00189DF1D5|nr:C40 family peptidase [Alkalibacter mobilis]MBF7097684.1 C40 family peptidase [Alkalibacter mobilis]